MGTVVIPSKASRRLITNWAFFIDNVAGCINISVRFNIFLLFGCYLTKNINIKIIAFYKGIQLCVQNLYFTTILVCVFE